MQNAADRSGATLLGHEINPGDLVGNVLGVNNGGWQVGWSAGHLGQVLGIFGTSPHSNYYCDVSACNFNINLNTNLNSNSQ